MTDQTPEFAPSPLENDQQYGGKHTQNFTLSLGITTLKVWTTSNRAVQIWVDLADMASFWGILLLIWGVGVVEIAFTRLGFRHDPNRPMQDCSESSKAAFVQSVRDFIRERTPKLLRIACIELSLVVTATQHL